jgi:hypothetical protein
MRPERGGLRYPEQAIAFRLYPEGWWVRAGSKLGLVTTVLADCHGNCYGYYVQFGLCAETARFCKRSPKLLSATRKEVEIITGRRFPNGKSTTPAYALAEARPMFNH